MPREPVVLASVVRGVAGLLLVGLVLLPALRPDDLVPDGNEGVTVTDYRASYTVDVSGTLRAAETLTVSLARPQAGLERRFDLQDPGVGRGQRLPRQVSVTRDGQAEEVELDRGAGTLIARLGDHDRELTGEHVYELRWTLPGVLVPVSEEDPRARLRLDLVPAGWGAPVLRTRSSVELPDRVERVACRAAGAACRPRLGGAGVVVTTGRLPAGEAVRVDAVLASPAPAASLLPWPPRLVPVLGERWWPPVVALGLSLAAGYAGARLAACPRPRRTRLAVVAGVLTAAIVWWLAPWTLLVLVPGAFVVGALPLLRPQAAGAGPDRGHPPA